MYMCVGLAWLRSRLNWDRTSVRLQFQLDQFFSRMGCMIQQYLPRDTASLIKYSAAIEQTASHLCLSYAPDAVGGTVSLSVYGHTSLSLAWKQVNKDFFAWCDIIILYSQHTNNFTVATALGTIAPSDTTVDVERLCDVLSSGENYFWYFRVVNKGDHKVTEQFTSICKRVDSDMYTYIVCSHSLVFSLR